MPFELLLRDGSVRATAESVTPLERKDER
jgi:hypothetical protein